MPSQPSLNSQAPGDCQCDKWTIAPTARRQEQQVSRYQHFILFTLRLSLTSPFLPILASLQTPNVRWDHGRTTRRKRRRRYLNKKGVTPSNRVFSLSRLSATVLFLGLVQHWSGKAGTLDLIILPLCRKRKTTGSGLLCPRVSTLPSLNHHKGRAKQVEYQCLPLNLITVALCVWNIKMYTPDWMKLTNKIAIFPKIHDLLSCSTCISYIYIVTRAWAAGQKWLLSTARRGEEIANCGCHLAFWRNDKISASVCIVQYLRPLLKTAWTRCLANYQPQLSPFRLPYFSWSCTLPIRIKTTPIYEINKVVHSIHVRGHWAKSWPRPDISDKFRSQQTMAGSWCFRSLNFG